MSHHTKAATKRTRNLRKQYKWEAGSQKGRCKWVEGKKVCTRPRKGGGGDYRALTGLILTGAGLAGMGLHMKK